MRLERSGRFAQHSGTDSNPKGLGDCNNRRNDDYPTGFDIIPCPDNYYTLRHCDWNGVEGSNPKGLGDCNNRHNNDYTTGFDIIPYPDNQ